MSKPIRLIKFKRTDKIGTKIQSGEDFSVSVDSGEPLISEENGNIYLYVGDAKSDSSSKDIKSLNKFKSYPPAIVDRSLFYDEAKFNDPDNQIVKLRSDVETEGGASNFLYPRLKSEEILETNAIRRFYITSVESDKFGEDGTEIKSPLMYTPDVYIQDNVLYGAAWNPDSLSNDYAESRMVSAIAKPGDCVVEVGDGTMILSDAYLLPTGHIVSDTYGHRIGGKADYFKPVAIAGRVLARIDESNGELEVGDAVMTAPNGRVAKMTRRQIKKYPDRIVGIVSEIPTYEKWGKINVDGRVWINIK